MKEAIIKLQKVVYVAIILLVYFYLLGVSFDLLTKASTISNAIGFIGLTFLLTIGLFSIGKLAKYLIEKGDGLINKKELSEAEQKWKEHIEKQMEEMRKMHEQNEALDKKTKSKTKKVK